jgi:heparosan-N-sulfate-glucuronate 5-epimerase
MKKIVADLSTYCRGSSDFMLAEGLQKDPLLYPIDLEFSLLSPRKYYSPTDTDGLPIRVYKSVGVQYNPTRIAAFGLAHWNRLRKPRDLAEKCASELIFIKVAEWFCDNCREGLWLYHFNWEDLKAPWISCMAQGEGISVLVRAAAHTKSSTYLDLALSALTPFNKDVSEGGVRSRLASGRVFFEEYPSSRIPHVLNGYLYAIIGLIDLFRATKAHEVDAMLSTARVTLERNIHLWDVGGWSYYDLVNVNGGLRNPCTATYHRLQASQLMYVGTVLGSSRLVKYAKRWEVTGGMFKYRMRAAIGKICFRLRNKAQR